MPSTPGQRPEDTEIVIELRDESNNQAQGIRIDTFKSYSFNSHFLTPTDGWSFTLGDERITDKLLKSLRPGQRVSLKINGLRQSDGYIDQIHTQASRAGTEVTIEGRDRLATAVDANIDPRMQLVAGMTLDLVLLKVFQPFGFSTFVEDNDANRNVITGQNRGIKTTKKGKPTKSFQLHQLKPYPHESAFNFAARITQRHGLWIWPTADGDKLVVARPDFDQQPIYQLKHKFGAAGAQNNVITATATRNIACQPSVIVATGFGAGGQNPRAGLCIQAVNPVVVTDNSAIFDAYPTATRLQSDYFFEAVEVPYAKPLFLHDDESKTPAQLANYVRRELAMRVRKSLTYACEVEGHVANGAPWAIDTTVDVNDDACGVHERMWVLSRTFTKSRGAGTATKLELIRLNTLDFFGKEDDIH